MSNKIDKFYLVSVDMGYGHQRASYPFLDKAEGGVITINNYEGASLEEKAIWEKDKNNYDAVSRFKAVPLVGDLIFSVMDYFQRIEPFYPKRDLSKNSLQQIHFFNKVKKGVGKNLIKKLNKKPLAFVTTFFVAAYAAEHYNYKGPIYCIVCDADISRAWAPIKPKESKIIYFAPNQRVKERLILYGVKEGNILVTGFPLPMENIGEDKKLLIEDLKKRIAVLDPYKEYRDKYSKLINSYLCPVGKIKEPSRNLTILFAVGGAGAQQKLGKTIIKKLKQKIIDNQLNLKLVAGSRKDVYDFFLDVITKEALVNNPNISIIYNEDKNKYFEEFNLALRDADVLYTKPSELSFYSGLGVPILMAEPIGSQEHYNRRWLLGIGAGVDAKNPKYIDQWLFDFLKSGWLAEASMRGFLNAPKMGTYNIINSVLHDKYHEISKTRIM